MRTIKAGRALPGITWRLLDALSTRPICHQRHQAPKAPAPGERTTPSFNRRYANNVINLEPGADSGSSRSRATGYATNVINLEGDSFWPDTAVSGEPLAECNSPCVVIASGR